jgi:hypothetical protein
MQVIKNFIFRTKYGLNLIIFELNLKFITMSISFFTQSIKDPAAIYVRVREANIDAKTNTGLLVNRESFNKGEIKLHRIPSKALSKDKKILHKKNSYLNELQVKLDAIKNKVSYLLNNRDDKDVIDSTWLKEALNPNEDLIDLPNQLSLYFEKFLEFKKSSLKSSTIKKNRSILKRVIKYEEEHGRVLIHDINNRFSKLFQLWCDNVGYDHNTKLKTLKVIKTVCNHAADNGISVHPQLPTITKGLRYKNSEHVHLSFTEIEQITKTEMPSVHLETAKDWLIISCYTAQRVSDFLRFTKDKVISMEGMDFLDISQEKTDEPVLIPLTTEVKKILDKRGGDFPPIFTNNVESNKAYYNKLIKKVCESAGIDNTVSAKLKNHKTNRYETKEVPKFKAVSTHIGRRSFATNYYGKINSALLIAATGHASEQQFLRYVGKTGTQNALALAIEMRKLARNNNEEPKLKVVKKKAN